MKNEPTPLPSKQTPVNLQIFERLISIPPRDKSLKKEHTPKKLREAIIFRDVNCQLCGAMHPIKKLEIHHIIPNGPATEENLILLCENCHEGVHIFLKPLKYNYPPKWIRKRISYA